MWPKSNRDYKRDASLLKHKVEPSRGIVGCEMHDLNGWGNEHHIPLKSSKKGFFRTLISAFFNKFKAHDEKGK